MNLSGSPIDYLAAFLGGAIVSLSPCVYPLIPISVSFIGIRSATSKLKGLTLSLIYVTGIAITYSFLGLLASLTGKIFGAISSHPLSYIFAGTVITLFGISMLDAFKIPWPNLVKAPTFAKHGYFSAFILGLNSGLIVSPCTTPVLGAILVYLTTKKNIFYGTTLLFSFAYGMGLVLILAGTFSSLLIKLPKSGKWMLYAARISAFILIGMGIYFVFIGIRRF
jgi:thiol:disulfide interchange protein DsbD